MPKVLVLSYASINEPHRAPYDRLAREPGWDVHVVAPNAIDLQAGRQKSCDAPAPDARYVLHRVPVLFGRQGRFTWFVGLRTIMKRVAPDVVFVEHDPGSVCVLQAAVLAPRSARFPFSVENIERNRFADAARALAERRPSHAARDLIVGALVSAGERVSTGIACISEEGRRIFEKRVSTPVAVVPLGTDMTRFRPMDVTDLKRELGLAESFVFGYFGRLVPEKGAHLLIEALARLPERFKLLLDMFKNFEPGSYAASLLARADELGVRDRIVTVDVPHQDVPRYMNVCDALVLPSLTTERWKEQFGRVLPEAMACGVPVIGSRSGNIPHMIGEAGLLVAEGDVAAIVSAVLELDANPQLRARLRTEGRARVERLFSVEAQVASMQSMFSKSQRPRA